MNTELQTILTYMEKERGLDREVLIQAVEFALQSASRKNLGADADLRIAIDRKTCDIKAFATVEVVEQAPAGDTRRVSLAKARLTHPQARVGDRIEIEMHAQNLGRIAAQTAKQAILQKIRQAERDIVYEEYKNRVGDIVSGTVRQFSGRDIVLALDRGEGVMPGRERVPTEEYQVGDRIRAYIVSVQPAGSGPSAGVILSRTHPDFVRAMFRLEVSEVNDGVVEIKAIARDPGFRTKIAVWSRDEKVDPVGACVGVRGSRVKNIVRELAGEKIDIIRWHEDIRQFVAAALAPAKLGKVVIDAEDPNLVRVTVEPDQLSLAIGKRGQNVRLTSKLVGWKVDIQKDESGVTFEEKVARAVSSLAAIEGIGPARADALVKAGFLTIEGILAAETEDLADMAQFDLETARQIHDAAAAAQTQVE